MKVFVVFECFEDGDVVTTSLIVEIDPLEKWVKTLNTKYILGKPYEDKEKTNRFISLLKIVIEIGGIKKCILLWN